MKHVAATVVVSLGCVLVNASCGGQRLAGTPEAEGAGGGAQAIELTDDDSFGSDPDVGGSIGSDPDVGGSFGSAPVVGGGFSSDPDVGGNIGSDPDVGGDTGSDPPASTTWTDPGDAHNPYYPVSIGQAPPATPAHFGPKQFPFRVINKDDGLDKGAGWQVADAKLDFVRMQWWIIPTYHWQCRLRVGMPLRTELLGIILPRFAADISAKIATDAANALLPTREWQGLGPAFCHQLIDEMNERFRKEKGLGAKVEP